MPNTWISSNVTAGDTVLASHYNNLRSDTITPTIQSARVVTNTNAAKTITNGTPEYIQFETESHDSDSFWVATNTGTPPINSLITRTTGEDGL